MSWFNDLKIRKKLLLGFGTVIILSTILGIIGFKELRVNDKDYSNLIDNVMSRSQSMTDIGWSFARYRYIVSNTILQSGDKAGLDSLKSQYNYEKSEIQRQFDIFNMATSADARLSDTEKANLKAISDRIENLIINEFEPLMDTIFEYAYNSNSSSALLELDKAQKISDSLDTEISVFIKEAKDNTAKMSEASTKMAEGSELLLVIISLIIIILGIVISIITSEIIIKRLADIRSAAHKISMGDFTANVGSNGKDEIAELSNSLLEIKTVFKNFNMEMDIISNNFALGELDQVTFNVSDFNGQFKHLASTINKMIEDFLDSCLYSVDFVANIGDGNFDINVRQFPGQRIIMTNAYQSAKDMLSKFNQDIANIIDGATQGNLDISINSEAYKGGWKDLAEGVNNLLGAIVSPIRETIGSLDLLAEGNLNASITGDYKGEFANMKSSLNNTLKMLGSYIKEISSVLEAMSNQNLTVAIKREYAGEFSEMRTAINNILSVFNKLINEINAAATQVSSSSKQMAESSMNLAEGTTRQATSVQELNENIENISGQIANTMENTAYANKLAHGAKEAAEKGNSEMFTMLTAMSEINDSSTSISKIIKVIEDIAFQTNLLALNAAVEAARAGEHGKGFAVVAEEVRNLAARSQSAAKETSVLIENSSERVGHGSKIADNTAKTFEQIVSEINEITNIISKVAEDSVNQATAAKQINEGINRISLVTQSNSATSEEQASASEELSSQAELFKSMVSKFKL